MAELSEEKAQAERRVALATMETMRAEEQRAAVVAEARLSEARAARGAEQPRGPGSGGGRTIVAPNLAGWASAAAPGPQFTPAQAAEVGRRRRERRWKL